MCGIAGFWDLQKHIGLHDLSHQAQAMAATLAHRGPDDSDVWADQESGVALAHTRLAIIDLTEAGHQPMVSSCRRFVVSYNGEVYNTPELKSELEKTGRIFRGHCDTETILEGCAHWGAETTACKLIGMFAFALWDRKERSLTLVRDRLGIKPLYWGRQAGQIVFASELKALRTLPGWVGELDKRALAAYLRHNYIPAPLSIYKSICKLKPGTLVTIMENGDEEQRTYWSMVDAVQKGRANPLDVSDDEAVDTVEELLSDSVRRRMISDVPFGAFLSGGIDSSIVTALMQANSRRPVRTFSIGFHEKGYNEAPHAKAIAQHLGTEHTEQYVTWAEAQTIIPRLPEIYDEPFADSSQIPTFLLSQMTRKSVTVALSGDGGDELFAGYDRYVHTRLWRDRIHAMPSLVRSAAAFGINILSPELWDQIAVIVPARLRFTGEKLHKLAAVLKDSDQRYYQRQVSQWQEPAVLLGEDVEAGYVLTDPESRSLVSDYIEWMQYADTIIYLPDDILAKIDRASMAVSLEVRVPLLDHRMVELAWRLPSRFKMRDGMTKWLLRQLLYKHVPRKLIERPKMGFGVPIDHWLRKGQLREWAEGLLDEKKLAEDGLFDPGPIRKKWHEHISGTHNWQYPLWVILMFQAWREAQW